MTKKTLSVLLALLLVLSLFPTAALAEQTSEDAAPQLEDQLPEAGQEDPDEDGSQDVEDILTEGRPSVGSDTEPSYPSEPEPEADPAPEEETVTAEFITSGPDIVSGGKRPARVAARAADVNDPAEEFFGGQLGTAAYDVYDLLYKNYFNADDTANTDASNTDIDVSSANASTQDVLDAAAAFDRDYPQVFWLGGMATSGTTEKVNTITFEVQAPWADATKRKDDSDALTSAVAKLASDADAAAKEAGGDAYAVLKYIHDTLVNNNAYNTDAANAGADRYGNNAPWEAISALSSSYEPVCEGYARAFKLVCDELTIPCVLVSGLSKSSDPNSAHMWNYVMMSYTQGNTPTDKWYLVDVTHDDPITTSGSDVLRHSYFLAGKDDLTALKDTRQRNTHFMSSGSSYNMDFGYPTLSDQSYLKDLGATGLVIQADPEATREVSLQGGGSVKVYEVPAATGMSIDLSVLAQGQGMTEPQELPALSMVTWTPVSDSKLTLTMDATNGNNAKLTIKPGTASKTDVFTIPLEVANTGALCGNKDISYMYVEKATPKANVTLGAADVEIPADDTPATLTVNATSAEDATATIQSVKVTDSKGQAVTGINATVTTVNVGKGAPVGTYTVTVTMSDGAIGTATFTTKKATSKYTALAFGTTSTSVEIPESGKTGTAARFTLVPKDQYGDPLTDTAALAGMTATFQVFNGSKNVTDQFEGKFSNNNRTFELTAKETAEAGSAMLLRVTVGGKSADANFVAQKFTFNWSDKLTNIETANPVYGMTWKQLLSGLNKNSVFGDLGGSRVPGLLSIKEADQRPDAGSGKQCTIVFQSTSNASASTPDGRYVREYTYTFSKNIEPKPITITIANASRYYGQANPKFTATPNESQLVSGDSADSLKYTLTTAATATSAPDTYDITGTADASSNSNYQLTFVKGTLTVKPAQMKLSLTTDNNTVSMATAEAASGNLTALGLPVKVGVTFTEDDKSTVLNIADAPTEVSVTWAVSGTLSLEQALVELKKENAPDFVDLTLTPTVNEGQTPAWARQFAEKPTFTLRVTGREVATITVENWGTDYAARIYDGTAQKAPQFKVTGKDSADLGVGDATKFTSQYELASDPGKPLSGDIKDAGTYRLVATYRDDTYYGRFSQEFTISPKQLTGLTWAGTDARDYDGTASNVTATVTATDGLIDGDVVTVRVTGGTEKNAGTHTATAAGLTGADAGNYTLPDNKTTTYTINKANRTLTVTIDHAILSPKTGLTGTLTVTVGGDDATSATVTLSLVDPAARASADVVSLDSANRRVTAIGNGTAQVTASVAATTNYNAATATPVAITAYARPITGAITVTSSDENAKLKATLVETTAESKVVVSGIWAKNSTISSIATDLFGSLTSAYADGTLTVKDGGTVVAEYAVDTSAVQVLPDNVKVSEESETSGTVSAAIPEGDSKNQVTAAVRSDENKLEGAVESAAETLVDIATAETEKPENAGKTVTVQVDLKIEAKAVVTAPAAPTDAKKASYTIDVQPVCSVYVTDSATIPAGTQPVRTEDLSSGFTTPVTVTVELPAFLVTAIADPSVNLFAKHTRSTGAVEYLEVDTQVKDGKTIATWQMSSFSDVELYAIANKSITVNYKDSSGNTTQSVTYGETDRGGKLLANKTWTISGQQYTTVDELLDSALTGTVDATPYTAPVTPVDPTPSRPSGGGGGGGGGGSSFGSYSISAPTSSSKHGSVSLSTTSAKKGDTVTLTPKPDAGYVLDTLVVRDSSGKQLEVKAAGDGKYTFVMPAGQVTVEATFRQEGESGGWPFADVDRDSFWAADAIAWVHEQGYMNGNSASTFNPDGTITRQQMWMILARLSGQNPASFAEARQWAMDSGVSDGTNGPNAMSRQQMVTFLYRYAQLRGYTLTGSTGIDAFPDSGLAAGYAQEPLAWAVGNGIVTGTSAGTLNPTGTATRAQFAVILQRFCENTAKD